MDAPQSRPRRRRERRPAPAAIGLRWIAAALVLLAALRFVALGRWGLWIDEAHTLHDARALDWAHPPAFPLNLWLTRLVLEFAGPAPREELLRAAPALLGVLGLGLTAWCFRPLLGRHRALVSALLLGLSSWHLYWSQNARAYTLAQSLSLAGAGLVLRGCVGRSFGRYAAGLALAALAALAHPSASLLVPPLFLAPWLGRLLGVEFGWRPPARWVIAVAAVAALVLATWAGAVWSDYQERKGVSSTLHFVLTSGFYFGPALGAAALLGLYHAWRQRDPGGRIAAAVCALVLGSALAASLAVRVAAYYVFVLLPWVCALASLVVLAPGVRGWLARALSTVVVAVSLVDLGLYFTLRHGDRPRWKEAFAYVARTRGPDDAVFGMAGPVGEYYLDPKAVDLRDPERLVRLSTYGEAMLYPWVRRERTLWLVINREDLQDWEGVKRARFETFLREQCERVRLFEVGATPRDLDVAVYRAR